MPLKLPGTTNPLRSTGAFVFTAVATLIAMRVANEIAARNPQFRSLIKGSPVAAVNGSVSA